MIVTKSLDERTGNKLPIRKKILHRLKEIAEDNKDKQRALESQIRKCNPHVGTKTRIL